jgi:hypothetical protein
MTRFLAPAGRYFPDLPDTAADEASLVSAALAEIGHGTTWVKVIADFPDLAAGTDAEATYQVDAPVTIPKRRRGFAEGHMRVAELLPLAVRLGVPVPAGTDVTGSIPWEVALLAQMGLDPEDALAAGSTWPWRFLGAPATADIVTYHHDPRQDPDQSARPAAVVVGGIRLRRCAPEIGRHSGKSPGTRVQVRAATRRERYPPGRVPGPASGAAAKPALKFAQRNAVRCEECRDLVVINRIGQNPQGLPGGLGETGLAQRQSEMLPGVLHRQHQALVVLLAIGGSRLLGISAHQGRCARSADRWPSPPMRSRTAGGPDCPG